MRRNAHGTFLKMSDMAATPVFTTIAQVIAVTPPGISRGTIDVEDHDMTGAAERLADALYKGKPVTLTIHHDPAEATHADTTGLMSVVKSGVLTNFQLIFPTAVSKQFDFAAFVTDFQPGSAEANTGKLTADIELTPSGAITEV